MHNEEWEPDEVGAPMPTPRLVEVGEASGRVEMERGPDKKDGSPGAPLRNLNNTIRILTDDAEWQCVLGFNERTRSMMFRKPPPFDEGTGRLSPRPVADVDITRTRSWIETAYRHTVCKPNAEESFGLVARRASYEPVLEWMDTLEWDSEERLDEWAIDYLGAGEKCEKGCDPTKHAEERCDACQVNEYVRQVSAKWLISGVARTYVPGCKADHMLITDGVQGGLKSTLLRTLAMQDDWFTDDLSSPKNKDAVRELQGPLIVEMAELDVMKKQGAETMKAFITRQSDWLVDKFEKIPVSYPRRCIFAGGTNSSSYLKDHTGNRRYWSIYCTKADVVGLREAAGQLWAEAKARYDDGATWWLESRMEQVAARQQEARRQVDPWQTVVDEYIDERLGDGKYTAFMEEVYHNRLDIDLADRNALNSMRIGQCFEARGWVKGSPRNDKGRNENGFSLPMAMRKKRQDGGQIALAGDINPADFKD